MQSLDRRWQVHESCIWRAKYQPMSFWKLECNQWQCRPWTADWKWHQSAKAVFTSQKTGTKASALALKKSCDYHGRWQDTCLSLLLQVQATICYHAAPSCVKTASHPVWALAPPLPRRTTTSALSESCFLDPLPTRASSTPFICALVLLAATRGQHLKVMTLLPC